MSCRVPRNWAGSEFLMLSRMGKCCTIFDFENFAVLISLETLLVSAGHPLESVCFSAMYPLEDVYFSDEDPLENKKVS